MPKLSSAARKLFLRKAAACGASNGCTVVENLESRQHLSVSINSAGWTVVMPAANTRIIYVSSSAGNDANTGLSPNYPVASIAKGESLLENNSADWMLLKCGDTWNTGLGTWRLSGESAQNPLLVSSYGTGARPMLNTGSSAGLWAASVSTPVVNYLDVIGLHFVASSRVPGSAGFVSPPVDSTGIDILTQSNYITIENCQVEDYTVNINLQSFFGPITNASVRRNIVDDAYSTNSHSQGMYAYGVNNLLVEGNTFDANGFNTQVHGAGPTFFNHDCYISANNTGVVVDENIFANASAYGLQDRPGGTVENNLFINDPVGMTFGLVNGADTTAGGVSGIVNGNVFVGGGDMFGQPFGQGILLGNTKPGYPTIVSNNIFADGLANAPAAINLTYGIGQIDPQNSVGLNDLQIEDNIVYNWDHGVYISGGMDYGGAGLTALNDVTFSDNDFQNVGGAVIQNVNAMDSSELHFTGNTYSTDSPVMEVQGKYMTFGQWSATNETGATQAAAGFPDPTRSLETYDTAVGGPGTDADFLAGALNQAAQNWNPVYTANAMIAYMEGGFGAPVPITPVTVAAPTPTPARISLAPTPPVVSSVAFPQTALARESNVTFTVTYLDSQSIDTASLSSDNLTVTAPRYAQAATFVSATGNGSEVTATYSIPAPHGQLIARHSERFTISINPNQVTDTNGSSLQAGSAGSYDLHVLPRAKPPTVTAVHLTHRGQSLAVRFSDNVSASLNVADLVLTSDDGQVVNPSQMTLSWNSASHTAVWSFTGEPGGYLPAGNWHVRILAATIVDSTGQNLDGNHNGTGGDDYVSPHVFVSRGVRVAK